MTHFILNWTIHPKSHSDTMDTSECFIFGKICYCRLVLGNMGKYNPPSIMNMIICPLGIFTLIIFIVGCKFVRWADTSIKFPVNPESATAKIFCSIYFLFFLLTLDRDYYINMYFKCHCKLDLFMFTVLSF